MMTWAAAIEATRLGVAIRQSTWMFAAMEVVHLFGLTLVLGTALVVNLRIFGLGLRQLSIADLVSETRPWNAFGLVLSIGSGVLLLVSEAVKLAGSPPFAVKMALFAAAWLYPSLVHRHVVRRRDATDGVGKASAALALFLWFGVALAGRAIAFY
jgi:hypothetical protein